MSSPPQVRVVLADRAAAVRKVLSAVLAADPGVVVVGETGDVEGLARLMRTQRPDVVVVDDRLFGERRLRLRDASVRVIVIGVDDAPAYRARARGSGAEAWIRKEQADELLPALLHASPGSGRQATS